MRYMHTLFHWVPVLQVARTCLLPNQQHHVTFLMDGELCDTIVLI